MIWYVTLYFVLYFILFLLKTQVSLLPPPCEEFTTKESLEQLWLILNYNINSSQFSAAKGLKSTLRGESSSLIKQGEDERLIIG
jgi:hypothetical protein